MTRQRTIYIWILSAFLLFDANAQRPPSVSMRDSVTVSINGKRIGINYGKLSKGNRKIFGSYVPYYKVWRTGAGAATILTTEADLEVDGAIIPRGIYSLYTLPSEERWKLIVNKQTGQWGTVYNSQLDLARIDLKIQTLPALVEELTFKLEKGNNSSGILKIEWEQTSLSVPFHTSKDSLVPSPRDSIKLYLNGKRLFVDYGRPSVRGRKIIGGVVPYGTVWRTGANAATSFSTEADLIMGGRKIPHGTYTLYTLPTSKQWKLIINKQTGQWGTVYNKKLDLARIPMKKKILKQPVEKFTIELERVSDTSGLLKLSWEKTQLSINFQIQ